MSERKRPENGDCDQAKLDDSLLSTSRSSTTLEIVMDDQSLSNSANEDSNSSHRPSNSTTNNRERLPHRRRKQFNARTRENQNGSNKSSLDVSYAGSKKDPKSHRLIEKRRRDRMNACLSELLELTPHEVPETQRRIEKTEIIEMAIRHMRHLISNARTKDKTSENRLLDNYRMGYRNGVADLCEYLDSSCESSQPSTDLTEFVKEKESDLAQLTVVPSAKRMLISSNRSDKKTRRSSPSITHKEEESLCVISEVEECKTDERLSSIQEKKRLSEPSESNIKVPIFVLHPSGTHYIPMSIDSSIVQHAFTNRSTCSRSTSTSSLTTDQVQCHPVSIPVNFNPISSLSDPYELEIQNINVIGTRHQTSVRPN